ncbi:DUF359 domain-containing protein [Aeropyrum camini]|uniref:DUF359 domain-containing protein n=1 Tax=Aeropyrum camini TaxID=229980 RepID=UPI000788646E|nr:DUF359 domain-containing protein [Aeropyrum camini]
MTTKHLLPVLSLPEDLRESLASAAGPVYSGERFVDEIAATPCGGVACIGDFVSQICLSALSRRPDTPLLLVLDGKTRRESGMATGVPEGFKLYQARSPPGHLSLEVYSLVCSAIEGGGRSAVVVEGEEDLAALAALDCGSGWTIVYGLPGVGGVVVHNCLRKPGVGSSGIIAFKPGVVRLKA